jgi:hypothetical protein
VRGGAGVEELAPLSGSAMVSPTDPRGDVVRAYLAGDSLRSIAAAANLGSYQTLRLLSSRIADRGEMERSRSLRRRCFSTAEVLPRPRARALDTCLLQRFSLSFRL